MNKFTFSKELHEFIDLFIQKKKYIPVELIKLFEVYIKSSIKKEALIIKNYNTRNDFLIDMLQELNINDNNCINQTKFNNIKEILNASSSSENFFTQLSETCFIYDKNKVNDKMEEITVLWDLTYSTPFYFSPFDYVYNAESIHLGTELKSTLIKMSNFRLTNERAISHCKVIKGEFIQLEAITFKIRDILDYISKERIKNNEYQKINII